MKGQKESKSGRRTAMGGGPGREPGVQYLKEIHLFCVPPNLLAPECN